MATRSYNRLGRRGYGQPLGVRLITALESKGHDLFTARQAVEEGRDLGLDAGHVATLLHQLAAGRWITRIKKGLYALNDPATKLPKAHAFALGAAMVTPSAVSHWSALHHWGLTEQIPLSVTLSSPVRTFPPAVEGRSAHSRPAWSVGGVRYVFVAVAPARFFGLTQVWVDERHRVPIFDRERALLDAFHHFHIFGSLSVALGILDTRLAEIDVDRLVQHAVRLGVGAVVKRVGWSLEALGVPPHALGALRDYPTRGDSPLDPARPPRGRHHPTWHVIENLRDEP